MFTGPWQIILIVVVVLLLFGAKRIPDLAGSIGKGIKEFKKGVGDANKGDGGDDPKKLDNKEDADKKD